MLCILHRHVGLSRPFYVNEIYSFSHSFIHKKQENDPVVYSQLSSQQPGIQTVDGQREFSVMD